MKLQKNQFTNKVFKCKLKKAHLDIVGYHEQVYNYWKKEVAKMKKKKFGKEGFYQKEEVMVPVSISINGGNMTGMNNINMNNMNNMNMNNSHNAHNTVGQFQQCNTNRPNNLLNRKKNQKLKQKRSISI